MKVRTTRTDVTLHWKHWDASKNAIKVYFGAL